MIYKEGEKNNRQNCTLSDNMIALLVKQISHELYNHNLYRSFANFFGIQGLFKLEEYYILRADEEKKHHEWIATYLNECDAEFKYPEVPAIAETWNKLEDPFQLTVNKEIETTLGIYSILDAAMEEKDWSTVTWLTKPGLLIDEQHEEETITRTILDIVKADGSWLTKQDSVMDAYKGD